MVYRNQNRLRLVTGVECGDLTLYTESIQNIFNIQDSIFFHVASIQATKIRKHDLAHTILLLLYFSIGYFYIYIYIYIYIYLYF